MKLTKIKNNWKLELINNNDLSSKQISNRIILFIIILFISLGYVFGSLNSHPNVIEKVVYSEPYLIREYSEPFNEQSLKKEIERLKIKHPKIVFAQAKLETGNFKSRVFIENNNLFGMKKPSSRVTLANGENMNHATFINWKESLIDYSIYQSLYLKGLNEQQYLDFLKQNYASDSSYIYKLQKIMESW